MSSIIKKINSFKAQVISRPNFNNTTSKPISNNLNLKSSGLQNTNIEVLDLNGSNKALNINRKKFDFAYLNALIKMTSGINTFSNNVNMALRATNFGGKEGFNRYIKARVNEAGYGSRDAVVAAALCLASEYPSLTGQRLKYHDDVVSREKKEQLPNTEGLVNDDFAMDCSNFAWWSLYNGGFKIPAGTTWDSGQPTTKKIKPWAIDNGYAKTPGKDVGQAGDYMVKREGNNGHIRLIIDSDDIGYYTAESSSRAGGLKIDKYSYSELINDGYSVIDMTDYYTNTDNIR